MLIPFHEILTKYNLKPSGIIHIGSHMGEELSDYLAEGINEIIFIEAIESKAKYLKERCKDYQNIKVIHACVSDVEEEIIFKITNNGQSSSMLDLKEHLKEHPEVFVTENVSMKTTTMQKIEHLLGRFHEHYKAYDFLNIDIQGAELKALRGMSETMLTNFKAIYTEVNTKEIYSGCALLPDMDKYLTGFGFKRVAISMSTHGWGDALFIKK